MIWSDGNSQMNRLRASLAFVFTGGLLIFLSPYFIYEAAMKRLPWIVPVIVIPIYAVLSYGAFKAFWPHIIGKPGTTTPQKDEHNKRN
jgi:hypothetical protein